MAEVASQPDDKFDNNHRNLNGKSDPFDRNESEEEVSLILFLLFVSFARNFILNLRERSKCL